MPAIKIKVNGANEVSAEMRDIYKNQIPFATARAITKTLGDAQKYIRTDILTKNFTLRHAAFIKAGVRITPATKQKLEGVIQDIDRFMALQETGGTKFPYGSAIAVPIVGGARKSSTSLVRDADRPHALMASGMGFIRNGIMYKRGADYKRARKYMKVLGPGAAMMGVARSKVTAMYVLVPRASLKPRYEFQKAVYTMVAANWRVNFADSFQVAVKTAKR
ncbi:MAG: hypothetical protein JWO13_2251 [Acidobacteriales bacterium]|nr:hypothetical protein [Terriglobales bacterium]